MRKILIGISFGTIAGIIDVIPMMIQKLTLDANISAFSMWVIVGFLLSTSSLKLSGALKGVLISLLSVIPCAILIGWKEPFSLVPIVLMTIILGSSLGTAIDKFEG